MAKEEKGGSEQQVAEALISGLIVRCNQCVQARIDLADFEKKQPNVTIEGTQLDRQHDRGLDKPGVQFTGPFRVVCTACNNTGMVLSDQGKRFLSIMQEHMPRLLKASDPRPDRANRAS